MPDPPADVPRLDTAGIEAAFLAVVRDAAPDHVEAGRRLFARLPPDRWALEWHLPWWLGEALGLDEATRRAAVASNVLGLAFVRLEDDLVDGDLPPDAAVAAPELSRALFEAALRPYRAWFDNGSPFWQHLDATMDTWRTKTEVHDLVVRGAPLRIGAYGLCLRAGRPDAYPNLERCLDLALAGLVRYDHLADWRVDLDAGRWNAVVADLSPGPQTPSERPRRRRETLAAMLASDAVGDQFGQIRDDLLAAAELAGNPTDAAGVPIPGLAAHLAGLADSIATQGADYATELTTAGERAARLLLQRAPDDR